MQAHRNYISLLVAIAVAALWLGNVALVARDVRAEAPVVELDVRDSALERVEVRQREPFVIFDNGDVILTLCSGREKGNV